MSFDSIPSKSEVLSWDSHRLADFLKRRNLTGCDKVITRHNISGQRFLDCDDDDYEDPNSEDGDASGGDYESPEGSDSDNGYEPPPTEPKEDTAQICPAKPMENSDYIDNNRTRGASRSQPPVPPERPGPGPSLPPVERPSAGQHLREERPLKRPPAPAVDRSTKPGTLERNHPPPVAGGRGTSSLDRAVHPPRSAPAPLRLPAVELPGDPMRIPKPSLPPLGVRRSASSVTPGYSQNSCQAQLQHVSNARQESITKTARNPRTDMDPSWYVGQITRGEAESCLRRVNRDGTFLVRDSSNRSSNQPYTLVVLYQDKVYNIQIRRFQNGFMLGTGMKSSETFERVGDIINQHRHMPLLLIDAKNRVSGQQNQCALICPARY
ncbi:Lymphocyte cytosolic protein 2 [Anabarilius grahami]|uniref:Lymphocyte cytosolic protein 2 n=1 Tax=Anabarilius grahami TaxID=495550 RepID=A0A3N0YP90_ANAGA|nr:Lymphocyte cytosolic protein 2 [Anabarilius grahami]